MLLALLIIGGLFTLIGLVFLAYSDVDWAIHLATAAVFAGLICLAICLTLWLDKKASNNYRQPIIVQTN